MTEDNKKSFTVKDRRHFTADGETRDEAADSERTAEKSADKPEIRSATPPSRAPAPRASAEPAPPRPVSAASGPESASGPEHPDHPDAGRGPGLDFAGLLLSLGAQASLLLGLGDEDETGAPPDLQGAQAIIALLEVLRDKTEGRRTRDEDRILEGILYELRMAYVSGTRAGGA
jgi:hypothetical protein